MNRIERYERAQEQFQQVLEKVAADRWANPTACADWTARDIAGHVIWGLDMIRTLAAGAEFDDRVGAPGAPRPRDYLGDDPLADWHRKRAVTLRALTPGALDRVVPVRLRGPVPLAEIVTALTVDFLTHAWDLGPAIGVDVRLDPELVDYAWGWAEQTADGLRGPVTFAAALPIPEDADPQTRLLRFLGRDA
ncbi:maleylpyruvate isomerase family mycothiol-dependent enzyme [Nocardia sp. CDC159]|uniref:Maleylpyruvate isomerase family mycothiol-dependent enzyme n=1 Tax=Nocardia pulmonis TaxID=2951408 RepID=A0A9X2IWZ5_9NOCA|nr:MULTISPECIES: TIGR03086 family metal-binding protein [Nocardia]MCM6773305.1 maleylpyruvate isomerase family mycothiol-dependent enzyme [Nocardia pulmonis]MCM6786192.1 maleylpyruvate isomerase family mycothiol-dependent enzyme [Nocardia sp. CDC159]